MENMITLTEIIRQLKSNNDIVCGIWADGDDILCKTEEQANHIADFLEALGFDYVTTGYYDPEEDKRNNEVDHLTGWYYVNC